jgi:hypothetical protein
MNEDEEKSCGAAARALRGSPRDPGRPGAGETALFGEGFASGDLFSTSAVVESVRDNGLLWAVGAMVASHVTSFVWDFLWRGEYRQATLDDLMQQPYGRVVVLHFTVLSGGCWSSPSTVAGASG